MAGGLTSWICAAALFGLRLGPIFAAAPPFTLVRLPVLFRMLLGLGLAASLLAFRPETVASVPTAPGPLLQAAAAELMLGIAFALVLQLAFAAIFLVGRTVDIQAGFGLALLIDPTSGARTPLIGTLLAFIAGMLFFAMGGQYELVGIVAASLDAVPLGAGALPPAVEPLLAFLGAVFIAAAGCVGGVMLSLFLVDLAIAMLSRTAPQMNVLVLGFQVKVIVLLIALPATLGLTAALLARLMRMALATLPEMLAHG
jgi:flagellar biosynthetic protein FliR